MYHDDENWSDTYADGLRTSAKLRFVLSELEDSCLEFGAYLDQASDGMDRRYLFALEMSTDEILNHPDFSYIPTNTYECSE